MRVFVTGASSGLGRALAVRYAARGATLGLVARRRSELEALALESKALHAIYALDVRNADALRQAAADFVSRHGCPDVVIANAGVSTGSAAERPEDLEVLREVIDINVMGVANTLQPFVACMRAAGQGRLVGIASVAGYRGLPGAGAYSASKAAAISYLESLRVELYGSGVHVCTVSPGYVATPMTSRNPYRMPFILEADEAARRIMRVIEQGRRHAVIPWQMAIVARVLRAMPDALYDRLFARAPRKPRRAGLS
ncbi:MAG: SDR family oxidoreductase [Burkholderiales bacterium]